MPKTLNIVIRGMVQGVGFRFSSYEKFVELGLTGKAENGKDGSVVIIATGEDQPLNSFIEWAHVGPQGARVESVEASENIQS